MTDRDYLEWIADWMMETGSLLFWWNGSCGDQPILFPLYYPWWLDERSHTDNLAEPHRWN